MATHRAVHVETANGPLQLVDVETSPSPPDHVRIAVHACGVCGTDREFVHGGFPHMQLISPAVSITGHPAGTAADIEDTMNFAVLNGIRAQIQKLPLEEAPRTYAAMEDGHARYRMVLRM
jgi:D-arabinose 1-dehydrogenase-like Zn-dependent alcohol dehydrogenase